jgi:hypothetical protein
MNPYCWSLAQVNSYELMLISYRCYLIQISPEIFSTLALIDANWLKQILDIAKKNICLLWERYTDAWNCGDFGLLIFRVLMPLLF